MISFLLKKNSTIFTTAFALVFSGNVWAGVCSSESVQSQYDSVVSSASSKTCAGILKPENFNSRDPINGDLVWLSASSAPIRIGSVPRNLVVTDSGVLRVIAQGHQMRLEFWDASTSKVKLCKGGLKVEDVAKQILSVREGADFIQIRDKTTSVSYFSACENGGKEVVYLDLSLADRKILEKYGSGGELSNLTDPKVAQTLPEILGRDDVVNQIIGNLRSTQKRSTIMWGPAGVGKTAIVYRLAKRISEKQVPEWLMDWSVYNIDIAKLSEEGLKGKTQQKISEVIEASAGKKVILLFDEIHQMVGLGGNDDGGGDVTEALKTTLANGQLAVIGTTTDSGNEVALLRTREAFFSRFAKISIAEPNQEVLMLIYKDKAKKMAQRHGIHFPEALLLELISLTSQYIPNERHPRIGVSLIENLASKMEIQKPERSQGGYTVTLADIRNEIGVYGNVKTLIGEGDASGSGVLSFKQKVAQYKTQMQQEFLSNPQALNTVHRSLVTYAAGNNSEKGPAGVFLFLGPSGVGKTYLAELTAQYFDMKYKEWGMSQYVDDSNITTFLGAPPSFLGYNPAGGLLTQFINQNPTSVLNFDEVDKADPRILEALMGLIDTGKIVDNAGVEAEFKNGFIFLTSNFGMEMIDAYDKHVLGIKDPNEDPRNPRRYNFPIPRTEAELKSTILNQLRADGKLGTYLAGRIGESRIVIFHHLKEHEARMIAKLQVTKALKQLNQKTKVRIDEEVMNYIAKNGFSFDYGARRARDLIREFVLFPVSEKILEFDGRAFKEIVVKIRKVGDRFEAYAEVVL